MKVEDLEPHGLWKYFAQLSAIPRPSGREQRVSQWLREIAASHRWPVVEDDVANMVIRVPATVGHSNAPVVILQAHTDMVCEKNSGTAHDFFEDPIELRIADGWVTATDTTLGADNGIGVAAALAAATDETVIHGPLELLFTVNEETGLNGAKQLDGSMLKGRILLNMDADREGKLLVGCAGNADARIDVPCQREPTPSGYTGVRIEVSGLQGGHSGGDIHERRGNAIKVLLHLLIDARTAGLDIRLDRIEGGSKRNALAREARAVAAVRKEQLDELRKLATRVRRDEAKQLQFGADLQIALTEVDAGTNVLNDPSQLRLMLLLNDLPHGVVSMSADIPGLVETSSNLAVVETVDDGNVRITSSARSSNNPRLETVKYKTRRLAEMAGASIKFSKGYPGWEPNLKSELLKKAVAASQFVHGCKPQITAIHAGLECALFVDKLPGADMISFGPNIEGAHSPTERVEIESVQKFWALLRRLLEKLA